MSSQITPPHECADMSAVRDGVDAVDRALIGLLAVRQAYMAQAATLKENRDAVRDEARIQDVLAKAEAEAAKAGLHQQFVKTLWPALVELSIAYEFGVWDNTRAETG